MDELIYRKLYKIASENAENGGSSLPLREEIFMNHVRSEADRVNVGALLKDVSEEDLLNTAFMGILKRMPDAEYLEVWKPIGEKLNLADQRINLVKSLQPSGERKTKKVRFYNNIFTPNAKPKRTLLRGPLLAVANFAYYKVYLKLPTKLRLGLRKIKRSIVG